MSGASRAVRARGAVRARRRLGAVAAVTLAVGAAVACSPPPTTEAGGPVSSGDLPDCPLDALAEAEGPVEVDLWFGGLAGTTLEVMEGMADRFNGSQDKVRVTANNQGDSYDEVYRTFQSATGARSQLPDIVYLEDTQLQSMVDSGLVLPAQACMEADGYDIDSIQPVIRSTYSVDDVLYPGYMNVSTPILYYNKSDFARAGLDPDDPPGTLDELHDAAVALKEAGIPRPFSFKMDRWFFETWLTGAGQDIVNNGDGREGQATEGEIDSDAAVELLTFLQRMNDEGLLNPFADTEGSIDHYLALVNRQSSMLVETSVAAPTIQAALQGDISQAGLDSSALAGIDLAPGSAPYPGTDEPGQVRASGGAFYMLNAGDPAQQAGAWEFLKFMLEPENAREWYVNGGYLPVDPAIYQDPQVQAFAQDTMAGILLQPSYDQITSADPDNPGPLIGPYSDVGETIESAMEAVILDGADPADRLQSANDEVTELLQRYAGE
jgi:sn-glycerol 3-phosphate transport system substrate-binding protein